MSGFREKRVVKIGTRLEKCHISQVLLGNFSRLSLVHLNIPSYIFLTHNCPPQVSEFRQKRKIVNFSTIFRLFPNFALLLLLIFGIFLNFCFSVNVLFFKVGSAKISFLYPMFNEAYRRKTWGGGVARPLPHPLVLEGIKKRYLNYANANTAAASLLILFCFTDFLPEKYFIGIQQPFFIKKRGVVFDSVVFQGDD